eukprot:175440-Rhodomonas_salina.1
MMRAGVSDPQMSANVFFALLRSQFPADSPRKVHTADQYARCARTRLTDSQDPVRDSRACVRQTSTSTDRAGPSAEPTDRDEEQGRNRGSKHNENNNNNNAVCQRRRLVRGAGANRLQSWRVGRA